MGSEMCIRDSPKVGPHARACAHTRPRHRRGVSERPHVRWSVERTASLAVAKPRCSGGQTRVQRWPNKVDLRAKWPLQGVPSEKVASGRCSPISTNHVALFGLSCTRLGLVFTLHLALPIFQQGAPCFGHRPFLLFHLLTRASFMSLLNHLPHRGKHVQIFEMYVQTMHVTRLLYLPPVVSIGHKTGTG